MAWIIDKDYGAAPNAKPGTNANAVGVMGPRGFNGDQSKLVHRFRMLNDDRELAYEGRSDDDSSFGPLDDFGEPNVGCTVIQYWVPGPGGGWKDL